MATAQARRREFAEGAREAKSPWRFVDALTGPPDGLTYDDRAAIRRFGRPLGRGEIGCYASHWSVWKALLDSADEQVIVLEDDVLVDWKLLDALAEVELNKLDLALLRLYSTHSFKHRVAINRFLGPHSHVVETRGMFLGTQGYVVTRRAAERLVAGTSRIDEPVDWYLARYWRHGFRNHCLFPFPIVERFSESHIGDRSISYPAPALDVAARLARRLTERAAQGVTDARHFVDRPFSRTLDSGSSFVERAGAVATVPPPSVEVSGDIRVSVVIPTYNRPREVARAVDSVLAQERAVDEIIVVDDASEAPLHELTAKDPRIKIVRHARNQGAAVARNTGVQHATGNWIAFLDSDDTWLPPKVARQVAAARATSGATFLCCNVLSRDPTGAERLFNGRPPNAREDLSEYFMIGRCSFQTSGLFIPARAVRDVAFRPELKRHQDWDLVLRLCGAGYAYQYCHDPLAVYWDESDGTRISQQRDPEPTLRWFDTIGPLVTPAAAAYLYCYLYLPRHLRTSPWDGLRTAVSLTTRSPRSLLSGLAGAGSRLRSELEKRVASTRNAFGPS